MINKIRNSIEKYSERTAFCINERRFKYSDVAQITSNIRKLIDVNVNKSHQNIGIINYDDIETYSSILACWLTNNSYVPINPYNHINRNIDIIKSSDINYILSSNIKDNYKYEKSNINLLQTSELRNTNINLNISDISDDDIMYILFTSGTTGKPKGVPINRKNLNSFVDGFFSLGYKLNENDRFLQMFDLSFDVSVQSYVLPLCIGASVYTVPNNEIKFLNAIDILQRHEITVMKMVPSTLPLLQRYFDEIILDKMKYSLFSGEALYNKIIKKWKKCVPKAVIQNFYGPTEVTIDCLYYTCDKNPEKNICHNDIISIGKPFGDSIAIIVDSKLKPVKEGTKGELCISGSQVTKGYLNNDDKNKESFFEYKIDNKNRTFYRTGDLTFIDNKGNYMFCGRIDNQIKIQGYRVELNEIEFHVREYTNITNVVALALNNSKNVTEIHLFLENFKGNIDSIEKYLSDRVPNYMIPSIIKSIPTFPKSASGKIDRNNLIEKIIEA